MCKQALNSMNRTPENGQNLLTSCELGIDRKNLLFLVTSLLVVSGTENQKHEELIQIDSTGRWFLLGGLWITTSLEKYTPWSHPAIILLSNTNTHTLSAWHCFDWAPVRAKAPESKEFLARAGKKLNKIKCMFRKEENSPWISEGNTEMGHDIENESTNFETLFYILF